MDRVLLLVLAIALAALGLVLLRRLWLAGAARANARAAYFSPLAAHLDTPLTRLDPSGFPRLSARWRDRPFDLRALPDSLTFRKLPALWLPVTLTAPQPLRGETRILARPSGQESFSTHSNLPLQLPLPPGFPDHCTLRAEAADALPPAGVFAAIARYFSDPAVKEVVLSPKGLRMTLLAEEAPRNAYLLYREAELGVQPLPAERGLAAMDRLLALEKALADA